MAEIRFIAGRAGSGKTQLCLDRIARYLRESPLDGRTIILLVPEQAAYQMERMLAGWRGLNNGFARAKVLSFRRLVQLVAKETSQLAGKFLLNTSRSVLMSQIISSANNEGKLRFWHNCEPDVIADTILRLIDELFACGLTVDELKRKYEEIAKGKASGDFLDKLSDVIVLAERYGRVETTGLIEPAKYFAEYSDLIARVDWLRDAILFVDGFSGFTGLEYKVLIDTVKLASECYISLCLDYESIGRNELIDERSLFRITEQTYARLTELAKSEGIVIGRPIVLGEPAKRRFYSSELIGALEEYLTGASERIVGLAKNNDIEIVRAKTPFEEVELVAGRIIELVRDKDYRYRDISVILRSLEGYGQLIRFAFEKYGIPYFMDVRRSISQHPLARLIVAAIGAVNDDFCSKWMLKYLKTGFTEIETSLADRIENYVLAHGIDGDDWFKDWRYKPIRSGREDEQVDKEEALESVLKELNDAREKLLTPLRHFKANLGLAEDGSRELDVNVIIDAIFELMKELGVVRRLAELSAIRDERDIISDQIHKQILDVLSELFSQMRITLADRFVSLDEFMEILRRSFSQQTVGVIPACVDQVLIGSIERSRHPSVRASFVLGYNETHWPEPIKEDVVLTDADREQIGWPDLPVRADIEEHYLREQYLNYIALTRPREYLWISYAESDISGAPLEPSRFLRRLREAGLSVKAGYDNYPITLRKFVSDCVARIKSGDGGLIKKKYAGVFGRDVRAKELFERFSEIAFDGNRPEISKELAEKLFSSLFSFSRLETFYKCQFQHFCKYGLGLREKVVYRLEPVDLGTLRHQVMKTVWQEIVDRNISLAEVTEELIDELVERAIEQASKELKEELLLKEARNVFILRQVSEELKSAVANQVYQLKFGRFSPRGFEYGFDVNVSGITLTGRIDRIDVSNDGSWAMVIDYKSGNSKFGIEDFEAGISLQLPGYLWVLSKLDDFQKYRPGGALMVGLREDFHSSGFLNEQALDYFISQEGFEGAGPYGIKIKRGGELYKNSKGFVWSDDEVQRVLQSVAEKIDWAGKKISEGAIEIRPYFDGSASVCKYCSYNSVCRFNREINGYRRVLGEGQTTAIEN